MSEYQVIVVGSGPTGLTTANLLGRYGVRTLLVERNAQTVQEPRAVSIDDESLRTMQAIGAIDTVMAQVVAGYGSEYFTPSGGLFLKVEPTGTPYGYPRRNAFRQPVLEQQLKDHLKSFGCVDTLFGWLLETLEQDDTGVTVGLIGSEGERRSVRSSYLVGADGASSTVRALLGLVLGGETFKERWLIVDLENSPAPSRETMVFCDVSRPCIALPGPDDTRRFEFKLLPEDNPEAIVSDENVARLLDIYGVAQGSKVRRKTVYTFHARLASQWTKGRVFLAGDACHLTPPFAGQGMNSGIRDAWNIAWKLAWVLIGALPASVLASYERERRAHVGEMIQLALRMGRIMGPRTRFVGFLTQSIFGALRVWPWARNYFAEMKYKPKPRFAEGLIIPDGRSRRTTAVGRLLPQPNVLTRTGPRPLDEVLGDGFALLAFVDSAELALRAAGHPALAPLNARRFIVVSSPPSLELPGVDWIVDESGALSSGVDAPRGRIFVVRPDRYVMGAFSPTDGPMFMNRLSGLLRLPKPAVGHINAPSSKAAA
jgi:3-(3-hydroxy-phenyl)propionate hydroxylase